jgi:hypothetical protein
MENSFEIPITYKGRGMSFSASLISSGYTYKIMVDLYGKIISFERDEERNFRAVLNWDELNQTDNIDKDLLKVLAEAIQSITK